MVGSSLFPPQQITSFTSSSTSPSVQDRLFPPVPYVNQTAAFSFLALSFYTTKRQGSGETKTALLPHFDFDLDFS